MGDMSHEPSMEDILSSIKKIIAEDGDRPVNVPRLRRSAQRDAVAVDTSPAQTATQTDVLELTEAVQEPAWVPEAEPVAAHTPGHTPAPEQIVPDSPAPQAAEPEVSPMKATDDSILAEKSVSATRNAFAQLNAAKAAPKEPTRTDNAIESLVLDALRPMLKEWLDANLPRVVEKMVAKEIARLREE